MYNNGIINDTYFRLFNIETESTTPPSIMNDTIFHNQYKNVDGNDSTYVAYSIFPNLQKYCLSGFAMAAMKQDMNSVFKHPTNDRRISTFHTFYISCSLKFMKVSIQKERYQYEIAEAIVHVATVIASHVSGLENATMGEFLAAFIRELDMNADDFIRLPAINFAKVNNFQSEWNQKKKDDKLVWNQKVPYLAVTDQKWNPSFIGFVKEMYPDVIFGTADYPSSGNDLFVNISPSHSVNIPVNSTEVSEHPAKSTATCIKRPIESQNSLENSTKHETFMCIEVKSHNTTTSDATTIGFINTLLGSPGSFFILVVRKITNETIDIDAEIRTTKLDGDQGNAKKTIKELITNPGSIFQLQRV